MIVILLMFSSIQIIQYNIPENFEVKASSIWVQTTKKDFNLGTYNGVCVIENDSEVHLKLEPLGSGTWEELSTLGRPEGRTYFDMASIDTTKNIVLFGGRGDSGLLNDTWTFDYSINTWTNQEPILHPKARTDPAMSSIYGNDKVLLFGGQDYPDYFNDTWIYDLSENSWINTTPNVSPKGRTSHAMAPFYGTDKVLLYGGGYNSYQPTDTWIYDLSNNTWTKKIPASCPSGVSSHSMASISGTDKVVLFGAIGADRQTWVYDLSDDAWTRKMPERKPSDRQNFAMASIDGTDVVMLFGGYSSNYNYLSETWIYDLSDNIWVLKTPEHKPSNRENHGLAPIYGTDHVLLFGGERDGYYQDTWIFKGKLSGNFISTIYDTEAVSNFQKLNWCAELPKNSSIKFQLRSSSIGKDMDTKAFVGPDGSIDSYYTISQSDIWDGHNKNRWIQYKAYFESSNIEVSPFLKNVTIIYNKLPVITSINPIDGWLTNNNKPTFEWIIDDLDFDQQSAFQVLIDDNSEFKNINYDSREQKSLQLKWQFPGGTNYKNIRDGTWYWTVRIKDDTGDWSDYCAPKKMTIDTEPPHTEIVKHSMNGFHNDSFSIIGSSSDSIGGSGVIKVEINIKRVIDDYYWDGEDWIQKEIWLNISDKNEWMFNSSSVSWTSGISYCVQARATDKANNVELPENDYNFTIDNQSPLTSIICPKNNSFQNYIEHIFGNCSDPGNSGINKVEISISRVLDNYYWDGFSWSSKIHWFDAVGKDNWTFNAQKISWSSGTQYSIQAKGIDNVGNVELPWWSILFTFDNLPPEHISIIINNGNKFTNLSKIKLTLNAEDLHSGISEMAFAIDNSNFTSWEKFNETKLLEIPGFNGVKNIKMVIKDKVGNIAEENNTVILDTEPPYSLTLTINNNAKFTNSRSVVLGLNAYDNLSGLHKMSFSNDGITWSPWEKYFNKKSYQLHAGYGNKRIHFRIRDRAGNVAKPITATILYNETSPVKPDHDDKNNNYANNIGLHILAIIMFMIVITLLIYISLKKSDNQKKPKLSENKKERPK